MNIAMLLIRSPALVNCTGETRRSVILCKRKDQRMYAKQTHLILDLLTIRHLTAVLADLDVLLTEVGVLGPRGLEEGRVGVHDQVNLQQAQFSVSGVQKLYKQTEHRAGVSDASKAWERVRDVLCSFRA